MGGFDRRTHPFRTGAGFTETAAGKDQPTKPITIRRKLTRPCKMPPVEFRRLDKMAGDVGDVHAAASSLPAM
jgi:hypothetical protein